MWCQAPRPGYHCAWGEPLKIHSPAIWVACLGLSFGAHAAGATQVYFAVGQSTGNDLRTGTPTCTVNGTTLTFSEAQNHPGLGVGCKVTYAGASVCYLSHKTSSTVWSCVNGQGAAPPQATGATVNSIRRAFASLQEALTGSTGPGFLNTSDLVTGNFVLNIPCYNDSGPDTTPASIGDGFTTGTLNYIRVYTPTDTATECNQSQRHDGKWNDARYRFAVPNYADWSLLIVAANVRVDGLQISNPSLNNNYSRAVVANYAERGEVQFSNNIIRGGGRRTRP